MVPRSQARRTSDQLDRAIGFIQRRAWREAQEILEDCEQTHSHTKDVLEMLMLVYVEQSDHRSFLRVCKRLAAMEPGSKELSLSLAGAYLSNGQAISALQAFRRFIGIWPVGELADDVREEIARLEPIVNEMLARAPFPIEQRLELAALHEEVLMSLAAGDYPRTIELGEQLLTRSPGFAPAMNNLTNAYLETGRTDDAIAMARRVLIQEPDNFHALANLARHLLLSGRQDEADEYRIRLRPLRSSHDDIWCKKAEALSFFGDDHGVIQALEDAREAGITRYKIPDIALLYHLAGVAYARQGDLGQAQQLWKDALKINPELESARDNLGDSKKPIEERDGPWAYQIEYWLRKKWIEELSNAIHEPAQRDDDEAMTQAARRVAQMYPGILVAVPLLLDRGDKHGRSFALQVAKLVKTPEMLEALRVFCLSQRGPDSQRGEIANYLRQKGILSSGAIRLWMKGAWHEIELLGFEITDEPFDLGYKHPHTFDKARIAIDAAHRQDWQTARRLLNECLAIEGDRPELLYNLAYTYKMQGMKDESDALARQIHERWPDYFFGQTAMADIAMREGDLDRAETLLDELRQRRKLHGAEFSSLCVATIQLFVRQGKIDGARSWLAMWKQARPGDPAMELVERNIDRAAGPRPKGSWFKNPFRTNA
jgi:tetratricopeptide (TPR) repeat protein